MTFEKDPRVLASEMEDLAFKLADKAMTERYSSDLKVNPEDALPNNPFSEIFRREAIEWYQLAKLMRASMEVEV